MVCVCVWGEGRGWQGCQQLGGFRNKFSSKLGLMIPSCEGSIWLSCLCLSEDRNHLEGRVWVA